VEIDVKKGVTERSDEFSGVEIDGNSFGSLIDFLGSFISATDRFP
jgi:hypothetical protein